MASVIGLPQVSSDALLVGLLVLAGGLVAAVAVRMLVRTALGWRGRSGSAATVFGGLAGWLVGLLAVLVALTVIFPSVKPVDILGGVGVVSIAAGIAFQTVLGNMFAGIVILSRDVIRVEDQIQVGEVRGTVQAISLSATRVRTFDGRLVLIPNSVLHSEIVAVQTGYETVRSSVHLDVTTGPDLDRVARTALDAAAAAPGVITEPAPQALYREVGATTVRLELRFWSGAHQLETLEAQDAVIRGVLAAFTREGIAVGDDVQVVEGGEALLAALRGRDADAAR